MANVVDFEDDRPSRLILITSEMHDLSLLPPSQRTGDRLRTLTDEVRTLVDSTYR